jgi:signal transduction histidine kinase
MNKTQQLEDLTRNLENEVAEEIAIRTRSEQILVQQSKMAAMGEMLGAIAHQWRQPLNALGLIIQNIRDAHDHGELDQSYIDGTIQRAMSQIRHMSHTIDDFRHFFQLDKDAVSFDTMLAVRDVLSLFSAQLNANEIDYQLTCHTSGNTYTRVEDISDCPENTMKGFRNEFEHVILNLINNAREAIIEKRAKHSVIQDERGLISFDFCHIDGKIIIAVGDNGGGLPENILSRIFEPYYTTKDPSKGTGLGLYMSKVIIEDHMLGKLTAKNSNGGAVFTIELPAAEERILK